jgi:ligand-binding sensor domain-containing protein
MRGVLLIIILVFISWLGFGQIFNPGSPFIKNFTLSEIDAGSENFSAVQDSRGKMFFGNGLGVLIFDGNYWDLIEVDNKSYVRSLAIDDDDRIYIGAYQEFGYLELSQDGNYIYQSLVSLIPEEIENFADIWKIVVIDDVVYFQSYYCIFRFDGENLIIIKPENEFGFGLSSDNNFYVSDKGLGLMKFYNGELQILEGSTEFKDFEILCLLDNSGLLVGTRNQGVFRINNEVHDWNSGLSYILKESKLTCGVRIDSERFAFGTVKNGIIITDSNGNIIDQITTNEKLQDNLIRELYVDRDKNLWSMSSLGIDYVEISSSYSILSTTIGSGYAACIHKNQLFLGTNQGLFWSQWKGNDRKNKEHKLVPNTVGQVWTVEVFNDNLIVGHHEGAFLVKDEKAVQISETKGHWQFLELHGNPDYILSGTYTGFTLFKKDVNGIEFVRKIDGFNESCRICFQDRFGYIWMSHGYKGIYRLKLNPGLDSFESIDFFNKKNGLPTDLYNDIFKYKGKVYITTVEDGLYSYDYNSDELIYDPSFSTYFDFSNPITKILVAPNNVLCNFSEGRAGLLTILDDTLYLNDFRTLAFVSDKLVTPFESICWDENENMIIGTQNGFVYFQTNHYDNRNHYFSSEISRFQAIANDTIFTLSGNINSIVDGESIKIPYKNNLIRVSVSANFFSNSGSNQFRIRLIGVEEEWSDWTTEFEFEFNHLREGDYLLEVESKNFRGELGVPVSFNFVITPPWYRKWYAFMSYIILIISIGSTIFYYVKKRTERISKSIIEEHEQKIKLEKELAEKELIKVKNDSLANEVIHKSKELANITQSIIHKNSVFNEMKVDLKLMAEESQNIFVQRKIRGLIRKVDKNIEEDQSHDIFLDNFDRVHENFLNKIRKIHPELTGRDLKICSYLRMNLSTKEIAPMLNITVRGLEISRYRLRKKMNLHRDINLTQYILDF